MKDFSMYRLFPGQFIDGGATTDVIPGAYGEYGLCATNPIPVDSFISHEIYFEKLRLLSGESFKWVRTGHTRANNISNPIDMYNITTMAGRYVCTLYVSPYQNVISSTPPKGFYIK